jgi:alkanesulfonate monooxygenase SsuD/methylene tetrahydromethanopterin reductase-like flavin-dependent oxidoreductase (luciferase family)
VDILSNGRLDLGVGKGYRTKEFTGFGIVREQREAQLEEGMEVIRRAWTEECFSFDGQYYHLTDVRLSPRPVQQPHPPLWIGARGKKAVERAARLGCHLMGTGEVEQQRFYDQALQSCGHNPQDFSIAQLRWVYLAESRERAWDDVEEHMYYLFTHAFPLLQQAGDLRKDRSMQALPNSRALRQIDPTIPGGAPIVGTPEDCIRAIERYQQETRITHLAMGMHLPGLAPEKSRKSLQLFAQEVLTHFK